MTRQEIDTLWYKAMHDSIRDNEDFIRYHFFRLAIAAEREACADICDQHASVEGIAERCAAAIRARSEK